MTTTSRRDPRASIGPILAVNFVATLGFSIVLPFLVYVVTRLGGNALIYGLLGASYSAFQLIGAPVLGRWSDRFGRKRILLLSQLGTTASWAVFLVGLVLPATPLAHVQSGILGAFTLTLPLVVLFVARGLDGITGGSASVANAYMADITTEEERAINFGRLAVSGNLGFIAGPAVAGLLGATSWGEIAPVTAALAISAASCLMIVRGLVESRPCAPEQIPDRRTAPRVMGQEPRDCYEGTNSARVPLAQIARLPRVPQLLAVNVLVFFAFNIFYVAFPVYVVQDLHWTLAATGVFFSVLSALMVLVQGPILTWAGRRWSDRTLTLAGSLILAISFPFFGTPLVLVSYAGAALLALGNGIMWPSLLARLARAAGPDAQGAVQGLAGSGAAFAGIAGLLFGGTLFSRLHGAVFLASAGTILLVFLLGLRIRPDDGR